MTILEPQSKRRTRDKTLRVAVYSPENKGLWDRFVSESKNGVFLFYRNYMEYHQDRFRDHSLLFFKGGKLVGVLPANLDGQTLYSHGGLTFGGVVSGYDMTQPLMLEIFGKLFEHCQVIGINRVVYKVVPYIYHSVPADEDLYALFRYGAELIARNVSSCIQLSEKRPFDSSRKDNLRKAKRNGLFVQESRDFESFMKISQEILNERHGVKPAHTAQEIKLLASRFPNNIKLFTSCKDDEMLAGVIMYESKNVAHMQYAANSKLGWSLGAQDFIEDYLINHYYKNKRYFDFGISTEKSGQALNLGLIRRKEDFGASAVMYDIYQIRV
ncbi:MAG: GNAT family N-acetyltransferase [Candidatus Bathyarchaeota archaeon]|nr:GNAT family N-acetyltransferase [Candidatus Bathyarchaeota archaeon]